MNANSIFIIRPYIDGGSWVFDDPSVGLEREPFVAGADVVINRLVEGLPGAELGFTLLFSAGDFPGRQAVFEWLREVSGGNWYHSPLHGLDGWLCPALFEYFEKAPKRLYVQARARSAPITLQKE